MPGVELVDPIGYSWVWTPVGVVLILAVLAWFAWVLWSTRPGTHEQTAEPAKTRSSAPPAPTADPFAAVREIYLGRLNEIKDRHESGELDARAVHLEIRRVMRDYTKARTGVDAATFTYTDAERVQLTGPLAKSLKQLSYPSFAARSQARPERSLYRARRVIKKW